MLSSSIFYLVKDERRLFYSVFPYFSALDVFCREGEFAVMVLNDCAVLFGIKLAPY